LPVLSRPRPATIAVDQPIAEIAAAVENIDHEDIGQMHSQIHGTDVGAAPSALLPLPIGDEFPDEASPAAR
jgi:hypothetical protein